MKNSKIEWCDHTFNPWIGCTKVSPGCANCYAEAMMDHRLHKVKWGKGQPRLANKALAEAHRRSLAPWAWNLQAKQAKIRHRVFCGSLCDWLDPEAPIELLARLLVLIERTPSLDWLLLTKRPELWPERMVAVASYFAEQGGWAETGLRLAGWFSGRPPANIWIGTTVENQAMADKRIPELLKIPAKVRFLSCEPLLGRVDITSIPYTTNGGYGDQEWTLCCNPLTGWQATSICSGNDKGNKIHWVICGGESGSNARPMHPDWARSLRDQCAAAGVPFLFKQWGEWAPGECADGPQTRTERVASLIDDEWSFDAITPSYGQQMHCDDEPDVWRIGKKAAGRSLDGREHNEFPKI